MPVVLVAVAAAAAIGGAVIASEAASANRDAAETAAQRAVDTITAAGAPPDQSKQIFMEEFRKAGLLTPELEKEINVQFEKVKAPDAKTVKAQQTALEGLTQFSKGGLTAEERVAQNKIMTDQARANEASKNSIIQNLAQRGQAGGGAELALRLQSSQANANEANASADRAAANAQQRALQSLQALGGLSTNIRGQEFQENSANANIANEQNRFNVANQLAVQSRNVGAKNQAQQYNLTNAQNIMNLNTQQNNNEKLRQAAAERQYWLDQQSQAQARANAYMGQATQQRQAGQDVANSWQNIGGGVSSAAMGGAQYANNQQMMDRMYPTKSYAGTQYEGQSSSGIGPVADGSEYSSSLGYYKGGIIQNPQHTDPGIPVTGGSRTGDVEGQFLNHTSNSTSNPSMFTLPSEYNQGGMVQGPEIVPGDSPLNDVVHIRAEAGEYIVPKEDAPSMELIHQILKGMKKKK
jgi:hypothetical protein